MPTERGTAKSRWERLNSRRDSVLDRARQAAALTIPSIMPPDGSDENTVLPTPYQSLGARGVNNLASKLLLTLLPPSTPFFRFQMADTVIDELGAERATVEEFLRKLENRLLRRIERGNLRVLMHAALKHLIVTGNALLHVPTKGTARQFGLSQFCAVRDPEGTVTEIVIKERVHPQTLSEEIREANDVILPNPEEGNKQDQGVDVFTWVLLKEDNKVEWFQEINEKRVAGTDGRAKAEESPYIALRWQSAPDEDYGRSLVEEYMGDLISLDGLSKAILSFSAASAKVVFLIHPNSITDDDALQKAESGDFVVGREQDIHALQIDKFNDFRTAKAVIDDLTLRLSHAFLLQSGTVRNAERVTAAEIQAMAQELEDVLGGVYTVQSQELQLPLVRRLIIQMKKAGEFPKLPSVNGEPAVEPMIITGFEALGRGHELNRMRGYFADLSGLLGPETATGLFNPSKLAKKLATFHNVDIDEELLSEEEVAQRQQQAAMARMGEAAAPAIAKEVTKGGVESITGAQNQT